MQTYQDIARRLREIRENPLDPASGQRTAMLTQRALAAILEVSPSAVAQYEAGSQEGRFRRPPLEVLQKWAAACGYRLVLHLAPASEGDPLVEELQEASPELRRLVGFVLRVGQRLSPDLLEQLEAALKAVCTDDVSGPSSPRSAVRPRSR